MVGINVILEHLVVQPLPKRLAECVIVEFQNNNSSGLVHLFNDYLPD